MHQPGCPQWPADRTLSCPAAPPITPVPAVHCSSLQSSPIYSLAGMGHGSVRFLRILAGHRPSDTIDRFDRSLSPDPRQLPRHLGVHSARSACSQWRDTTGIRRTPSSGGERKTAAALAAARTRFLWQKRRARPRRPHPRPSAPAPRPLQQRSRPRPHPLPKQPSPPRW